MTFMWPLSSDVTGGRLTVDCLFTGFGCRITGTVPFRYTNPTLPTSPGTWAIDGTVGLTSTLCLQGSMSWRPVPLIFRVTNGTGGTNPTLGPSLAQP
jgi:hypothetical protein